MAGLLEARPILLMQYLLLVGLGSTSALQLASKLAGDLGRATLSRATRRQVCSLRHRLQGTLLAIPNCIHGTLVRSPCAAADRSDEVGSGACQGRM